MPVKITPREPTFVTTIFLGIREQRSNLVRHPSDIGARYAARDNAVRPFPLWNITSAALPYHPQRGIAGKHPLNG